MSRRPRLDQRADSGRIRLKAVCAQRYGFRPATRHERTSSDVRPAKTPGIPEANHWNCLSEATGHGPVGSVECAAIAPRTTADPASSTLHVPVAGGHAVSGVLTLTEPAGGPRPPERHAGPVERCVAFPGPPPCHSSRHPARMGRHIEGGASALRSAASPLS